jgi:sulfur relay (sulfurtransferase) DsrF/TusC family protein
LHEQDIIFYQCWLVLSQAESLHRLTESMSSFFKSFPALMIKQAVVCADSWQQEEKEACASIFHVEKIEDMDFFSRMRFEYTEDQERINQSPSAFLMAFGLAMREVPIW